MLPRLHSCTPPSHRCSSTRVAWWPDDRRWPSDVEAPRPRATAPTPRARCTPPRHLRRPHRRAHLAAAGVGGCARALAGSAHPRVGAPRLRGTGVDPTHVADRGRGPVGPQSGGTSGDPGASAPALEERVLWNLGPPRFRCEEAVLDVAAEAPSDFAALAEIARAVQGRRTTAARLVTRLAERERIARRTWMNDVLEDVAAGTCSVLEHGHLTLVDRPHGHRPVPSSGPGPDGCRRDLPRRRVPRGLVIELDGRLFHDTTEQRDADFDRDLLTAVGGQDSVRLSYGQVFDRPCWTAAAEAVLLRDRGWTGSPRRCGPACWVGRDLLASA